SLEPLLAGYTPRRRFQVDPLWQTGEVHQQILEILVGFAPISPDLIAFAFTGGISSEPVSAQKTETGPAVAQNWNIDESLVCSATQFSWRGRGVHIGLRSHYP